MLLQEMVDSLKDKQAVGQDNKGADRVAINTTRPHFLSRWVTPHVLGFARTSSRKGSYKAPFSALRGVGGD